MSGAFSGIGTAQIGMGGVYFKDGKYVVQVLRVFMLKSRNREDLFIVETVILWSTNLERPAGMKCSWVVNMKLDAALGNIKEFLAACNGADPRNESEVRLVFQDAQGRDTTEAMAELSVSPDNPLAGVQVCLDATTKEKKTKPGEVFTLHTWSPYKPQPAA